MAAGAKLSLTHQKWFKLVRWSVYYTLGSGQRAIPLFNLENWNLLVTGPARNYGHMLTYQLEPFPSLAPLWGGSLRGDSVRCLEGGGPCFVPHQLASWGLCPQSPPFVLSTYFLKSDFSNKFLCIL